MMLVRWKVKTWRRAINLEKVQYMKQEIINSKLNKDGTQTLTIDTYCDCAGCGRWDGGGVRATKIGRKKIKVKIIN